MTANIKTFLFGLLLYVGGISADSYDLQLRLENNDETIGGNFDVTIQVKAAATEFKMGSANLVFVYNTDAFNTSAEATPPVLYSISNFSGGNYHTMTLTEPVLGRLSINIDLAAENNGSLVTNTLMDVATIRFTIKNTTESGQFAWRSISPNGVVVFTDDQAAPVAENSLAGESTHSEVFETGWNMIGLPNDAPDKQQTVLFPGASSNTLFSFNGTYMLETALSLGTGYWLNYPAAASAPVTGFGVNCVVVDLDEGWNMISGPSCDIPLANVSDPGNIIIPNTFFGFTGSYVMVDSLKQGEGYWVRTNQSGQITINCGTAGIAKSADGLRKHLLTEDLELSTLPQIELIDALGNKQTLYFNAALDDPAARLRFSLPPIAPPGANSFDVRFSGDYRLTESIDETIYLQAVHYPIIITAKNLDDASERQYVIREIAGNRQLASTIISENNSIEISNPRISELQLSIVEHGNIPATFIVNQNYPNPFNPSTAIRYGLPVPEYVEITIFNTLGQKIKTLVRGQREAGFHTAIWDSRNNAGKKVGSGLYIYRVQVGSANVIKKMILLK